ncbi:ABC transporter ATP-binding protein [Symbiobacterium thermophilum]|uniref:ABC transporter ATP-binding protein n=1 Tax=Symbiobacterium thermophilum (strain DSM 24528 / JCM 14929 / IAM 14863 / T) TaxID=292459 RepID=Q67MU2_SYMTH|nr:ABC transporter ATP-binding protein [Symbiobacterium thermophilum]BAD41001.1 ABC transporter ATP-binding protein [Symbiobacterium thermophilum IAM 14863]
MVKLLRFLKPYSALVAATFLLVFLQAVAELYLPTLMSDIVDVGVVNGDTGYILRVGGWMLLVALGGAVVAVLASYCSSRVAMGMGRDLRQAVFRHAQGFSLHEFDRLGTATLITRTTNDILQVPNLIIVGLRMMLFAPMMGIGSVVMALSKDRTLSLIIVVALPVLGAAVGAAAVKAIPMFQAMQKKIDRLNRVVREGLTGIRVIRAFNRTDYEQERFVDANRDLTETAIRVNRLMGALMPTLMLIMNLTAIAVVWFGGLRIDAGRMEVGDLMAFIQYVMHIMFSTMMLSMMFIMLPRASASAARINEVLEMRPSVTDPPEPYSPGTVRGEVEFRNVTYRYPGAERPALEGISFRARPGEVTAIIGGTGAGKTTLVNLIPRFYDVQEGAVLVDGVDVRQWRLRDLRAGIGYVPQRAMLFSGTIAANIRFGNEDASDEEVARAAAIAQAEGFIAEMKDGYDTAIAQGGTNVSGGQKQRLTIARALVRKPAIYIFDDNFSALDFKTDARLRAALKPETARSTVILVAQRVSTVMDADRIIVLDQGRVAGIGTHRELLQSCEVYREIVASQLAEEELA